MSGDGTLSFIVPVRHPSTVKEWGQIKRLMAETLSSIAGQKSGNWRLAVISNNGADLPTLPRGSLDIRVEFPPPPSLEEKDDAEAFYNMIRDDKGARIYEGLKALGKCGHVMVVDYDDLVSDQLTSTVRDAPDSPGWFMDTGLLFSINHWAQLLN